MAATLIAKKERKKIVPLNHPDGSACWAKRLVIAETPLIMGCRPLEKIISKTVPVKPILIPSCLVPGFMKVSDCQKKLDGSNTLVLVGAEVN